MSTTRDSRVFERLGLSDAEAANIGPERAAQVCVFRLILYIAQELRYLTDQLYREEGLTTQQATLLTAVRTLGAPSLSEVANALLTSHQNVKQLVAALANKGFLRLTVDREDARVRRVVTTAKNERYWKNRDPEDFKHVAAWFAGLNESETAKLVTLLAKLESGIGERVRGRGEYRGAKRRQT
jgi:DNA-binding MarR family transcriptional regulator